MVSITNFWWDTNINDVVAKHTLGGAEKYAVEVLDLAKQDCPVVTGTLKNSGKVVRHKDHVTIEFSANYAVQVHENPSGKGYKFVEWNIDTESYKTVVADSVKGVLK